MSKRLDVKKVLVIGSGPIVIGQAAEFDYAGTQAIMALKEEGYEVILCNSNPATIMTDVKLADKVYMEPLTLEYVAKIIRMERPDAIVPGLGGQTGLNLAMELEKKGILKECDVELLGTKSESIEMAEDRDLFKKLCERLGEPVLPSEVTSNLEEGLKIAEKIGYPVVLRPAFTLGGTGGGFAYNEEEFVDLMKQGLSLSPVSQVLIEKSIKGYKEIEIEAMRDASDKAIVICDMENIDPVGVHTGDSIVVCPSQTLTEYQHKMFRESALKIIRALGIEGGCNVQFALNPVSDEYYLIEVNPRVSRSSALASKASGYPIAKVTAKVALGMLLEEIDIFGRKAVLEPKLDYIVTKVPRFPFDKFKDADNLLGTQMKATGEIMSIGRTLEESLLKGIRSLETGVYHLDMVKFNDFTKAELLEYIVDGRDDTLFAIAELLRRDEKPEVIAEKSKIDVFFINIIKNIVALESELVENKGNLEVFLKAKKSGFGDKEIAKLWNKSEDKIYNLRMENNIVPAYRIIDSCAENYEIYKPSFYSTYLGENQSIVTDKKKIIVLGSGPIRIGQGVEFDYSTVHAVTTLREAGYEAIIINNNPETVSTDFVTSDKLYFEPLTVEDVMNVINLEKPEGVIVSLGGQTAINLAKPLEEKGVNIIGTDCEAINRAEDRDSFGKILKELDIPQPLGRAVINIEEGLKVAAEIGYPVLVRPSYVLGGRAMEIVTNETSLEKYLKSAVEIDVDKPVLVDKYIQGKELEVDGVCDGEDVFVPGIMELVERTGIHSGDSISIYPTFSVSKEVKDKILDYSKKLGIGIGIKGLFNIQFIVDADDNVYIIEVNPRSSRTVPFLSKVTGYEIADIGTRVMLGISLKEQGIDKIYPEEKDRYYVKVPAFSFAKLRGLDAYLSPEMKSTGEAIGYDNSLTRALFKGLQASGTKVVNYGTIFVTIADENKKEALPIIKRFYNMGFNIEGTEGTAKFLKENGIRTRSKKKISEGSTEILDGIRQGHITYVINTRNLKDSANRNDGHAIRQCAIENGVTTFTSLDTVKVMLDVLEDMTMGISTIDA